VGGWHLAYSGKLDEVWHPEQPSEDLV